MRLHRDSRVLVLVTGCAQEREDWKAIDNGSSLRALLALVEVTHYGAASRVSYSSSDYALGDTIPNSKSRLPKTTRRERIYALKPHRDQPRHQHQLHMSNACAGPRPLTVCVHALRVHEGRASPCAFSSFLTLAQIKVSRQQQAHSRRKYQHTSHHTNMHTGIQQSELAHWLSHAQNT